MDASALEIVISCEFLVLKFNRFGMNSPPLVSSFPHSFFRNLLMDA